MLRGDRNLVEKVFSMGLCKVNSTFFLFFFIISHFSNSDQLLIMHNFP